MTDLGQSGVQPVDPMSADWRDGYLTAQCEASALAQAIKTFLDWHGYDNAEGLADALATWEGNGHE